MAPSRWVAWPDFALPWSCRDALDALDEAHRRAPAERVELVCGSGTGRTGTALVVLAVRGGVPPADAITWVRTHYRARAVETPWQRWWVQRVGRRLVP